MHVRDFTGEHGYFKRFLLRKQCGKHSLCRFSMSIREEVLADYLNRIGQPLLVTLDGVDGRPIFCGRIDEISQEKSVARTCIEVTAWSESKETDAEQHTRIFQNPGKTFGDVLSASRLALGGCSLELDGQLKQRTCKHVLLQAGETNFAFIRRIADYMGMRVWVVDSNEGRPALKVASCVASGENHLEAEDVIRSRAILHRDGRRSMRLVTTKYYDLGRILRIGNGTRRYLITALELYQENGVDRFSYELEEYRDGTPTATQLAKPPLSRTVKLRAHVKDVNDPEHLGRVRVQFDKDSAEDRDTEKLWLPYRPPYGGKNGGIVFLPDVGDAVEVLFTSGECFVCSTLREKSLNEECRNVSDKYIGNNSRQRIFWKEKSLEIISDKNKIVLDDNKIEMKVGDNIVRLDSNGILLQTPKNKISLTDQGLTCTTQGDIRLQGAASATVKADREVMVKGASGTLKIDREVAISGSKVKLC